jgi:hypothetical protein
MTEKTDCCGWDVWGELAGIGPDGHRHAASEWSVQPDNRMAVFAQDPKPGTRARTAGDTHRGSHENR